jgi:hypothetical protein
VNSIIGQPPYQSTRLLLDGQQRLTSLSAVIRGEPVTVRGRKRPIELLFNLEHPDDLAVVIEVDEDGVDDEDDEDDLDEGDEDASEDELQKRFDRMTFVNVVLPAHLRVAVVQRAGVAARVCVPRCRRLRRRRCGRRPNHDCSGAGAASPKSLWGAANTRPVEGDEDGPTSI